MQLIGKLDKNKIGAYADKIITDNVIITAERLRHISEKKLRQYLRNETIIYKNIDK